MIDVMVFTRNIGKVRGVKRAFEEFFGGVSVRKVYCEDMPLPSQPTNLLETFSGAYRRARYCYNMFKPDFSVGIEGGIHNVDIYNAYIGFHVACIITKDGLTGFGLSSGYQVPNRYIDKILESEMANVLADLTGDLKSREELGFIGYLSKSRVNRVDLVYEAVRNALIYLNWRD